MNYYGHMVARLDGETLGEHIDYYLGLVRKGIAGFIVFGGEIESLREGITELQKEAPLPLVIASDLEQGLGQQVRGGTLFPPAMALSSAVNPANPDDVKLVKAVYAAYAEEALYTGINMILAPVADINTNPDNPVISVRSYGERKDTVVFMATLMIDVLHAHGVATCAKHFPGHGDTDIDSHLALPVLRKGIAEMEETELFPFRKAAENGVRSIMLAHVAAPAIDPREIPLSLSERAVNYLREKVHFDGLIMTDALNMKGLASFGEEEAGRLALESGVDILLHPGHPDELNKKLNSCKLKSDMGRIDAFRKKLPGISERKPGFGKNTELARLVTERSISFEETMGEIHPASIVVIKDDPESSCGIFENFVRDKFPGILFTEIVNGSESDLGHLRKDVLAVVFSTTSAWKGSRLPWFDNAIKALVDKTQLYVVFGNPYAVHGIDAPKLLTFWCSEPAERAAIKCFKSVQR